MNGILTNRDRFLNITKTIILILFVLLWVILGIQLVLYSLIGNENIRLETDHVYKVDEINETDFTYLKGEAKVKLNYTDIEGSKIVPYNNVRGNLYYSEKTNCILFSRTLLYTIIQILPWLTSTFLIFFMVFTFKTKLWHRVLGCIFFLVALGESAIIDTGIIGITVTNFIVLLLFIIWIVDIVMKRKNKTKIVQSNGGA